MTNRTVDRFRPQRFGILPRVGWIAGILIAETLVRSYWIQEGGAHEPTGPAKALYIVQSWSLRFVIAYVAAWSILVRMRDVSIVARSASLRQLPVRVQWLALHLVLLVAFGFLSVALYDAGSPIAFTVAAIAWHACCAGLVFSLLAAMAPMSIWHQAVSQPASLYLYALLAALIAVVATRPLQLSWEPVVHITYWAVDQVLAPFMPGLRSNSNTMSIGTPTFAIVVSERCSGLEGVGLIAAFCVTWFWYGRREFIFSRSLIVLPVAAFLVFSLNVLRIATLVAIGNAGYPQMAMVGFHSQAGWIAFNCAAFAVAAVSYRIPWLRRGVAPERAPVRDTSEVSDATAAYLVPFLCILAAGMIAHALSEGFDLLYPLRLAAGAIALVIFRRTYSVCGWRVSWLPCIVGAVVFCLWVGIGQQVIPVAGAPDALGQLSPWARAAWIGCRVMAAVVTVPIAEELAYRGYLMRRLVGPKFESIAYNQAGWQAILVSGIAFGLMHGALWPLATLTGIAYGILAVKSASLGDSVIAHGTTNALLALYVLIFDQWQLW